MGDDEPAAINIKCEKCGRPMARRRRRADGAEFLGCSGWPHACQHTCAIPEDVRMRMAGAPILPGFDV